MGSRNSKYGSMYWMKCKNIVGMATCRVLRNSTFQEENILHLTVSTADKDCCRNNIVERVPNHGAHYGIFHSDIGRCTFSEQF